MTNTKRTLLLFSLLVLPFVMKAQTFLGGGKLDGHNASKSHVQKVVTKFSDVFVVGYFTDSIRLDVNGSYPGGYTLMGAAPGVKHAFVAKYNNPGDIQWGFVLGTATDSVVINDIIVNQYDQLIIAGSMYGTVDFAGMSGTPANETAVSGADAFFALYGSFDGYLTSVHRLETSGTQGAVADVNEKESSGDIYVIGHYDGTIDTDPAAGTNFHTASAGTDVFIARYDYNAYFSGSMTMAGAGNEKGAFLATDWMGKMYTSSYFDNNIAPDPAAPGTTYATAGGTDVYYATYDASFIYQTGFRMGGTGNDKPKGLLLYGFDMVTLTEFTGTLDVNPAGAAVNMTSAGSTDLVVTKHDNLNNLKFVKQLGNGAANPGYFLSEAPTSMPARAFDVIFYVSLGFTGTIDVNPGAAVLNETNTNTFYNSLVIELDTSGAYRNHITTQATSITSLEPSSAGSNEFVVAGDFAGTNVDIMPYDSVKQVTHTVNQSGYINFFDECHMAQNITLVNPYECGTCTATLLSNVQGAIGGIGFYSWSSGSGSSTGATLNDACAGYVSCTAYDFHNCTVGASYVIIDHDTMPMSVSVTPVSSTCNNNYGSASAVVTNNIGPYSYDWSSGDTTAVADSLSAGTYVLNVTDSTGCYVAQSFSISDSDGPSITVNSTGNPACSGGSTGNIDVTISGGAAPLTILWSNGATTEDLTGLEQGTYALIVTDANGCQAQVCVSLTSSDPITLTYSSYVTTACGAADGSIDVDVTGGTAPYTYLWNDPLAQTTDSASALLSGMYTVTVTDDNGCTATAQYGVSDIYGPTLNWWYGNGPSCYLGTGFIETDFIAWFPPYTVEWSEGSTTDDLYGIQEGGTFLQQVTDDNGCKTIFTYDLPQILPNTPNICMVTVDSTGTQNVVIWDKSATPEADYYNIYREGFCSSTDFLPIGSVSHDSLSVFYDTVVNTETRSWKYYVTAVDTCGYESLPSEINKTIHLTSAFTASGDIELNWDAYVGREVEQYEIFRVDPVDSTLYHLIDSVSGLTLTYTDTDNFIPWDGKEIEYFVEAIPVNPCYASRAFNQNASRSNHTRLSFSAPDTSTLAYQAPVIEEIIRVFPNPANDRLTISIGPNTTMNAVLMNHVGQSIRTFEVNRSVNISTSGLPQGVYYLQLTGSEQRARVFKVIVAH